MSEHTLAWALGALAVIVAAFATRVQLLPDVIDISIIPTGSGVMSLVFVPYGAVRRLDPDRVAGSPSAARCWAASAPQAPYSSSQWPMYSDGAMLRICPTCSPARWS